MAQSGGAGERLAELPADACPYHRPFPSDFDECPAFIHRSFMGFDLQHRPLRAVTSCRHLAVGNLANRRYPRCEVGDAAARVEWARTFHQQRLDRLRQISQAFQAFIEPQLAELYRAKGNQLRNRSDQGAAQRLREAANLALAASENWLNGARRELEEAGLPIEPCRGLVKLAFERLVSAPSMPSAYPISEEQLEQFPASVREFIRTSPVSPDHPDR